MKRKFFSGNSIEQALMQAARHFELQPEEVAYRHLEKKHGFLRVRRRVVIEVDEENPRREAKAAPAVERERRAERPQRAAEEGSRRPREERPERPERTERPAGPAAAGRGDSDEEEGPRRRRGDGERRTRETRDGGREDERRPGRGRRGGGSRRETAEDDERGGEGRQSREGRGRGGSEGGGGRRRSAGRPGRQRSSGRGAADDEGPWWQLSSPPEEDDFDESGSFEVEAEDFEEDLEEDDDEVDTREVAAEREEEPEEPAEAPPRRDRRPSPRRRREASGDGEMSPRVLDAAAEAAERIAELAGLELTATARAGDDRVEVDLTGRDRDALLDEDAELLQAVEYLVPRVMRGLVGESFAVRVDSAGYRAEREESLKAMARETAELVARTGRPVSLEPMSPAERRIVHVELRDEPDVRTESQGDGYYKQVTVEPL
jgi:spoIIIJ-associated protein